MNTMNTSSKSLVLRGTIINQGTSFLATVDNLPLMSYGDTVEEAENRLVRQFRTWAESCEEKGLLEKTLSSAGYDEIDDETEIYLVFTDEEK